MMKNMTPENIARACHGTYFGPEDIKQICVADITTDSRTVGENSLFVALRGERVDGHSFIAQVQEKGALCVVVEEKP